MRASWMVALLFWAGMAGAQAQAPAQDPISQRVAACIGCHGSADRQTRDGYFPRIAGKPAGYLYNQLRHFRDGRRTYAPMNYLVANLSDAYLLEIANYFASLHPVYAPAPPVNATTDMLAQGRRLVMQGDPARKLPACVACHGDGLSGMAPGIPALLGLPRDYLNAQFGAWRNGSRRAGEPDCMHEVTRLLAPEEINAIAGWLASQPVPADMRPLPPGAIPRLPLSCGSMVVPQ